MNKIASYRIREEKRSHVGWFRLRHGGLASNYPACCVEILPLSPRCRRPPQQRRRYMYAISSTTLNNSADHQTSLHRQPITRPTLLDLTSSTSSCRPAAGKKTFRGDPSSRRNVVKVTEVRFDRNCANSVMVLCRSASSALGQPVPRSLTCVWRAGAGGAKLLHRRGPESVRVLDLREPSTHRSRRRLTGASSRARASDSSLVIDLPAL
jgi:hypothetical protein